MIKKFYTDFLDFYMAVYLVASFFGLPIGLSILTQGNNLGMTIFICSLVSLIYGIGFCREYFYHPNPDGDCISFTEKYKHKSMEKSIYPRALLSLAVPIITLVTFMGLSYGNIKVFMIGFMCMFVLVYDITKNSNYN